MIIRNINEDMVFAAIREVLTREKKIDHYEAHLSEIAAYVLNRIPPKYITSERGIMHGKLESKYQHQERTDLFLLIYEALEVVTHRRESSGHNIQDEIAEKAYFFPHIMGVVLEETTFAILNNIKVTLLHDNHIAGMMDESWANPYSTYKSTRSYYHFWPCVVDDRMNLHGPVAFVLKFEHPKCKTKLVDLTLEPIKGLDLSQSKVIPITLLSLNDGEDTSFLLEE